MATCQYCGENPGPEAASEAIRNAVEEQRYYRLHRRFPLNDHPRVHHGANRIEIVRTDADRRSIREISKVALKQVFRYWRESPELQRQYARLRFWVNEVRAELDRRRERARHRQLGTATRRGR